MNTIGKTAILAALAMLPAAAFAEDTAAGNVTVDQGLPEICTRDASGSGEQAQGMSNMMNQMKDKAGGVMSDVGNMMMSGGSDMQDMSDAGKAMMDGMKAMDRDMTTAMRIKDPDVAFLCGMIPHHRGAIAMAEAELKYGKNDWAKNLAKQVITAQKKEIGDMIAKLNAMK